MPSQAAPYVAHHLLAARPLNYHSMPDHLYWNTRAADRSASIPEDRACYTRTDQGWGEGLHPVDAFLKTTHEVLGPLNLATAHDRLTQFDFVDKDRRLCRATYGEGDGGHGRGRQRQTSARFWSRPGWGDRSFFPLGGSS